MNQQLAAAQTMATQQHNTFAILQRIIAETTGNDLEDITLDAEPEEDLGITMMELSSIVAKLQKELDIRLSMKAVKDCATVAEFVELIDDERDL